MFCYLIHHSDRMSTGLSSASDSEDDLVIVGESTSDGDAYESGSTKRETATAKDSESLLKIKASVYYDFFFVERENRLEKRNGRSRKLYLRIASSVDLQLLLVSNVF